MNAEKGLLKGNEYIVKTIVTTETIKSIADAWNIKMFDCYTGFKWIAAVIRDHEGTSRYLGGGEESYGFLAEDFARDKDSVSAISLMAEIAAWAKDKGMNFLQMLQDIYLKYGFSREEGISVVRTGKSGAEEIQAMMKAFRANPPKSLGGSPVVIVKDYADLNVTDIKSGKIEKMDMPTTSNVLQFFTEDGSKVSVRPQAPSPRSSSISKSKALWLLLPTTTRRSKPLARKSMLSKPTSAFDKRFQSASILIQECSDRDVATLLLFI